ncbi:ST8SIA1 [Branchiostoma lanceolatum]|uniref:ST8SIA1 protein n=1 Tax=Branchiostoma lanceolatum TaxID=7740 RepID=A0A8J9ZDD7_BRALA|nr:ST8SIA1 [Branchiostoma lanceolatum]
MRRRKYCAILSLFLSAVTFLLVYTSEPVSHQPKWTTVNSTSAKGRQGHSTVNSTSAKGRQGHSSIHSTSARRRPLSDMNYVKRHTPNESAALEKFQADQKFVQSIPTEAPGWVYNQSAADLFRRKLINDARLDNGNFLTTQENSPLNAILKTLVPSLNPTKIKVSSGVFNLFPKESPFKTKKFQTCSVVGNGGILKGSGCGVEIDASEFVFRCNMAPMYDEHLTDIGKKTSLITINPTLILYRTGSAEYSHTDLRGGALVRLLALPRRQEQRASDRALLRQRPPHKRAQCAR